MHEDLRKLIASCAVAGDGNPLAEGVDLRFCAEHGLSRAEFFFEYARHVAQSFAEGSLAFWEGNYAMNRLGGVALEELEGFALDIFHAFDHGEYLMGEEPAGTVPWQQYTLPQVMEALSREGLPPRA